MVLLVITYYIIWRIDGVTVISSIYRAQFVYSIYFHYRNYHEKTELDY